MSAIRVIGLQGELDLARRDEVRFALQVEGAESGILLDLSEATYADSTILSALIGFVKQANALGVPVAMLIGTPQLERIIQYAGLSGAMPIFMDRSLALTRLSEGWR